MHKKCTWHTAGLTTAQCTNDLKPHLPFVLGGAKENRLRRKRRWEGGWRWGGETGSIHLWISVRKPFGAIFTEWSASGHIQSTDIEHNLKTATVSREANFIVKRAAAERNQHSSAATPTARKRKHFLIRVRSALSVCTSVINGRENEDKEKQMSTERQERVKHKGYSKDSWEKRVYFYVVFWLRGGYF